MTSKIMVIRHGEKPVGTPPIGGVDANGNADQDSLTETGWQRARALATLFDPADGQLRRELAKPTALFASKIGGDHSKRPVETLSVLAEKLGIEIDQSFGGSKIDNLVSAVKKAGDVVLLAWKHEDIPAIAAEIAPAEKIPVKWPGERFDMIWIFDLQADGSTYNFSQAPELLLPGDSPDPI